MTARAGREKAQGGLLETLSLFFLVLGLVLAPCVRDVSRSAYSAVFPVMLLSASLLLLLASAFVGKRWPYSFRLVDVAIIALVLLSVISVAW